MRRFKPGKGISYSFEQIVKELDLNDSPFLTIDSPELKGVIQTSHVSEEDLLKDPAFATSRWTFKHETREWIPIFVFAGTPAGFRTLVDIEEMKDPSDGEKWWITPKGYHRLQYGDVVKQIKSEQEQKAVPLPTTHVTPTTSMTMGFLNCLQMAMEANFRPFKKEDFDQYSDIAGKTPLIAECSEFDCIVDDEKIKVVFNPDGPGGMTVLEASIKQVV